MCALKKIEVNQDETPKRRLFDTYNNCREERLSSMHERLADYDLDQDYLEAIDEIAEDDWTLALCLAHDFDKD